LPRCHAAEIVGEAIDKEGSSRSIANEYGVSKSGVNDHRRGQCSCADSPESPRKHVSRQEKLGAISDLLERSGIDVEDVGRVDKVTLGSYQALTKDDDGEAHIHDMERSSIVFSPTWETGPEWPVIAPAAPVVVKNPKLSAARPEGSMKRAITLPDIQFGYFRDKEGNLHPIHDEAAVDLALQLVQIVRPDHIVLHGDNLDLMTMGKYRLTAPFAQTTQAAVDRGALFAAQVRAAAGDECVIDWLEGNHEFRLSAYVIDNAEAAFGLRRGGAPDSWPVLSVPNLCNLDEQGISYRPGYPANEVWINERLRVVHGSHVVSNGSTAHRYLSQERASVLYGHIHRREWAERTRAHYGGSRTILAMSPGCLARTDGCVPSTKGGIDLDGMPIRSTEDWQSGVAVIHYEPGDGVFLPEMVPFISRRDNPLDGNCWTVYQGKELQANCDIEGNPLAQA
jgi:hypothetical protein